MSYQPRQGTIYFIRREDGEGPVKIGFSSKPWVRLESIDVCSPHPLTITAAIEGPSRLELRFHNLFRDSHIRREWFEATPELLAVMQQVSAGSFDVATLPEPFALICSLRPKRRWSESARRRISESRRGKKRRRRATEDAVAAG